MPPVRVGEADARTRTGDPFITRDGSIGPAWPETASKARIEGETAARKTS